MDQQQAGDASEGPGEDTSADAERDGRERSTRRSFVKRAGKAVLLVGAGAIGGQVLESFLRPEVPGRVEFPTAGPVRIDDVTVVDSPGWVSDPGDVDPGS